MRTRLGLLTAAGLLLVSGCGDEGGDADSADDAPAATTSAASPTESGSATPSESAAPSTSASADPVPTGPACTDVWVDGGQLPRRYQGCVEAAAWQKADALDCSSGQVLVRYAERFWAVRGGKIHETEKLDRDAEYRGAIARCRG